MPVGCGAIEDAAIGGLDADSSCQEYLDAEPEDQLELIRDLYVAEHGKENPGAKATP